MKPRIYKRGGLWFCEWPSTPNARDLPAVSHASWFGALSDAKVWHEVIRTIGGGHRK